MAIHSGNVKSPLSRSITHLESRAYPPNDTYQSQTSLSYHCHQGWLLALVGITTS